jgi:endonuclease/exonuclease/phosphatase family metal-dependent hydrolase
MKSTWIGMSLACIVFLNTVPSSASTMCVMTYNLQGMKPGSDPGTRIQHIIQNLEELNPDILGLQEINESGDGQDNQAQMIADSLSSHFGVEYHVYYEFTHLSWDNQFREFIGIISRFPVEAQGYGQLVTGAFPRKVVWNAIDTPAGRVNLFNTHLDFISESIRVTQVQQIIGFINQKEGEFPGVASILVGDFNSTPESAPIQLLTDTGTGTFYLDTYAHANPGSPGFTVPASAPNSRIDFIFEKNTGILAIDTSMVVMDEPYDGTSYCSDHLGVLTIFHGNLTGSLPRSGESALRLLPPSPNPSMGRVVIRYLLGQDSPVSLTIHSVAGHCVRALASGYRRAGPQEETWDCRDARGSAVASAAYFVRLEVGGNIRERRITVIQ